MSRQNKVNPGMYTQRGRLAQDDAAREIAKQRAIGSEHTWQPVQRDAEPRLTSESEGADDDAAVAAPKGISEKKPARTALKSKPAATMARKKVTPPRKSAARSSKRTAPATRAKAKGARTVKAKTKSAARRKS